MRAIIIALAGAAVLAALALGCAGSSGGSGKEIRSPGEIAFRTNCQKCHSLPSPSGHTDEEWPALVDKYGRRAKLSDSTIALITSYLTAHN